jgi:hypothetical protein
MVFDFQMQLYVTDNALQTLPVLESTPENLITRARDLQPEIRAEIYLGGRLNPERNI